MPRSRSLVPFVLPLVLGSYAVSLEAGTSARPVDASEPPPVEAAVDEVDTGEEGPERAPAVPTTTFASLDALCRAQMDLAAPLVAEANARWAERGETSTLTPKCVESGTALAKVPVALAAPFLEVRAIEVETGRATETHLVTRTAAGWFALGRASIVDYHDDPGCFSIERDSGLVSVRVEGGTTPALVVVESTNRGARMEEVEPDESGTVHPIVWDDDTHRARACRAESSGYVACDAPVVLRIERTPSTTEGGRRAEVRFATQAVVDGKGHLHVAAQPATEGTE